MSNKHILVLGAGSVGKRHAQNLVELGCEISVMDPRQDRLEEMAQKINIQNSFSSIDQIKAKWQVFDGVVVASPPNFHIDQTLKSIEYGMPVLLEKPLCIGLDEIKPLKDVLKNETENRIVLGYTYRWWRPLQKLRQRILNIEPHGFLHAKFVMSAHLADWHPWERYQDFFMASKELGGGALLDESHFIDLMYWFFGMPKTVFAKIEKLSNLKIETDDNVDLIFTYPDNLRVSIHLDLFGRPHQKFIQLIGENKTLEWSFEPNRIRFSDQQIEGWQEEHFTFERNDMFVDVAKEFIGIMNRTAVASCTLQDGISVMKIIDACRLSSNTGNEVSI